MNKKIAYGSVPVAIAGFLLGFDRAVISGADQPLRFVARCFWSSICTTLEEAASPGQVAKIGACAPAAAYSCGGREQTGLMFQGRSARAGFGCNG